MDYIMENSARVRVRIWEQVIKLGRCVCNAAF